MIQMRIFIFLMLIMSVSSQAKMLYAFLKEVENNHTLHMKVQQQPFICTPYGVDTISQLVYRTDVNSSCQKYLRDFRMQHPQEKFFAAGLLYPEQQYAVEGVKNRCLLYLSNQHTYSEALLEEGYARMLPVTLYQDPLLKYRYQKAVLRAKTDKKGLWSDVNLRNCFLIPKEE
jgi:hypothetical protein